MSRRFQSGMHFNVSGIEFEVSQGFKHANDRRLDWWGECGWQPIGMDVGFMLADFFFENEQVLYPPTRYRGGRYYLDACELAAEHGWHRAVEILEREKANRRRRAS